MRKKVVSAFLVAALMMAVMPMNVSARGHCKDNMAAVRYSLCNIEDCYSAELHEHDDAYYCGHYIGDGHDYHELCNVQGCLLTTNHEHNGVTCFPQTSGYGYYNFNYGRGRHH